MSLLPTIALIGYVVMACLTVGIVLSVIDKSGRKERHDLFTALVCGGVWPVIVLVLVGWKLWDLVVD